MISDYAGALNETRTGQLPPTSQQPAPVSGVASVTLRNDTSSRYFNSQYNTTSNGNEISDSVTPNITVSQVRNTNIEGFNSDQEGHPGTETLIRMGETWRNVEI